MKALIKELFRKNILEAREYSDDDIIDFNEISLDNEYDKLNNLLFNGDCKPIKLLWGARKTAHGHVKAYINRVTRQITLHSLTISKFYHITYKMFKDTLAHEMIHVYLLQKNINDNHGMLFQKEMNRINSMNLGFNVKIKSDSGELEISSNVKARNVIFSVISVGGKNIISVMTPNAYNDYGGQISNIYQYTVKKGKYKEILMEFYESNNKYLLNFKIQRSFKTGVTYHSIDENKLDELLKDSRKISEFYTDGNEVIWSGKKPTHI